MNPVAISFFSLEIRWYAIFILFAFLLGIFLVKKESNRLNLQTNEIIDLCFYLVIVSIFGARIYYVIFEFSQYKDNLIDIFKIWNGGLAIHGGILSGIIYIYFFCRKHKINLLQITDIIAPSLILGQAIGRWGNFFNSEAYGPITTLSTLKKFHIPNFIINGMYINNNYHHPTFLYESLWCLLGFIILILLRRSTKIKISQITATYFIFYGVERFFIESLRQDSLMISHFKVAQIISLIMILSGIILLIYSIKKTKNYN